MLAPPTSHVSGRTGSHLQQSSSMPDPDTRERPYGRFSLGNGNCKTQRRVSKRDGQLKISINETNNRGYLAHALGAIRRHYINGSQNHVSGHEEHVLPVPAKDTSKRPDLMAKLSALSTTGSFGEASPQLKLNIVVMVVGSRGDIQPFLKIGKLLKGNYGHRVRIATHPAFKKFVEQDSELEFFSVGGDPAELMAFMVKNPGLMPSISAVRAGEVGRKRESMFEMFQGFWRACINTTDDEHEVSNLKMMADKHPFVADAIIANPPCFANFHCAERLGVPLHLMFTFPYSPTQQFPHPLANIKRSNVDSNFTKFYVISASRDDVSDPLQSNKIALLTILQDMARTWRSSQSFSSEDIGPGACLYTLGARAALSSKSAIYVHVVSWLDSETSRLGTRN